MLQLNIADTTLDRYMDPFKVRLDDQPVYTEGLTYTSFRARRVSSKSLGCPELPYLFNIGKIIQNTTILQGQEGNNINLETLNTLLSAYEREALDNPNQLYILRMFVYDYKILDEYFETREYIVEKDSNISTLMHKTMVDTAERNSVWNIPDIGARIVHHPESKIIIELLNYDDVEQASDYFLLLGVIPMMYPDIKEMLNEKECKYLKELIRRSQVKRIRNVEVDNYFYAMYHDNKYKDAMKDLKLKAELENIMRTRTSRLRNTVDRLLREKDNMLQSYERCLTELHEAQVNLHQLENNDTFMDEVKTVMEAPYVIDLHAVNNAISITVKTNLEFYDPELLEICLNNTDNYDDTITNEFLKEVFIEGKYKMSVTNRIAFRLDGEPLRLPREISYQGDLITTTESLFNPHIEFYGCYGNNERAIVEAHQSKDLVGFINAYLIALKNVNFGDSPVFSRWYAHLKQMLHNTYTGDTSLLRVKALENTETHECITLLDWIEKYETSNRTQVETVDEEEAIELEPHEL